MLLQMRVSSSEGSGEILTVSLHISGTRGDGDLPLLKQIWECVMLSKPTAALKTDPAHQRVLLAFDNLCASGTLEKGSGGYQQGWDSMGGHNISFRFRLIVPVPVS